MRLDVDLRLFAKDVMYVSPKARGLGWSYFNVYSLLDFKNIYNVYYANENVRSIPVLLDYCRKNNLFSESGKSWTQRNLLEIVNALKKTGLLDIKTSAPLVGMSFDSNNSQVITKNGIFSLRKIYYSYFRFKDFLQMFRMAPNEYIVAYMYESRFFNRFISIAEKKEYYLEDSKQVTMRFWDVFTKWGMTLKILNKCSLTALNIETNCYELQNGYLVKESTDIPQEFRVLKFMQDNFTSECVYIPDLEREIIFHLGYHLEDIKDAIISECTEYSNTFRLQRITEIFIEHGERILFPFVDGSYMSHILKI